MIVVRVELWSAVTGDKTELARMHISNIGATAKVGDYDGETFIGRSTVALDRRVISKRGKVTNYRRLDFHVWNLVRRMLSNMGYEK